MTTTIIAISMILFMAIANYTIVNADDVMLLEGEYEDYYGRDESEPEGWTEEMEREYYGLN